MILILLSGCSSERKHPLEKKETILKEPVIDKRVELLSIVFRLAGSHEYSQNLFPKYIESIENHFGHFKNHNLIQFVKNELRDEGIGFSSVMSMAIHITQPPNIKPIITPFPNKSLEQPWGEENSIKFLKLLNEFYRDANCQTFFNENEELYTTASNRFKKVYQNLDVEWYQNFYGTKPNGEFRIIIGLGNGGANYGPKIVENNGNEIVYAIMGTWSVDSLSKPTYEMNEYFPTLLHEFNHSFVNHLVEKHRSDFQKSGLIIFEIVKEEMNKQAYGNWKTMYDEALVRSAVIKYMKDHNYDKKTIQNEINEQLNSSFLFTNELVMELERYAGDREKYTTFDSFMPEIANFFNLTAAKMDTLHKEQNIF
ncbi:MAG: DUF4932 domain-containing protein [Salibacteraceae bacterium]